MSDAEDHMEEDQEEQEESEQSEEEQQESEEEKGSDEEEDPFDVVPIKENVKVASILDDDTELWVLKVPKNEVNFIYYITLSLMDLHVVK